MRLQTCQRIRILQSGCAVIAVLLSTQSIGQQSPESQMPQAPKAPSVESLTGNTTPDETAQTFLTPELEGTLELNLQQADGQDNSSEMRRDTGRADVQLTLEYEQSLGPDSEVVLQLELNSRRFTDDELNNADDEFSYDLERFFYQLYKNRSLRIRAGRFGIDDPMESIVDEDLDGLEITFRKDRFQLQLSRTRKDWFEASTVGRVDKITNTMGSVRISFNKNSRWMPYVLHRSSTRFNDMPVTEITWLGLQGIVQPEDSAIRYWVHASTQDGEEIEADETTTLGGYLFDIGVNWTASGELKPTFTAGIAHATGGSRADRFRQSGLQSNDFALNGKNSFRYLGEVMDPELTNIQIFTLGLGLELSKLVRADIAFHHYQQVEADDALRGSDVEFDPLGFNTDLGIGADVVVGYEPTKRFELKGTAGVFEPGDAFEDSRNTAWLTRVELEYKF